MTDNDIELIDTLIGKKFYLTEIDINYLGRNKDLNLIVYKYNDLVYNVGYNGFEPIYITIIKHCYNEDIKAKILKILIKTL